MELFARPPLEYFSLSLLVQRCYYNIRVKYTTPTCSHRSYTHSTHKTHPYSTHNTNTRLHNDRQTAKQTRWIDVVCLRVFNLCDFCSNRCIGVMACLCACESMSVRACLERKLERDTLKNNTRFRRLRIRTGSARNSLEDDCHFSHASQAHCVP